MRIELVLIGDELLIGDLDPYPAEIAKSIKERGSSLARMTIVSDELGEIVAELHAACGRGADLLLVTGGLGPTIDDVTRHALASFLDEELMVDPEAKLWMEEALLERHGRKPKASSAALLMAMVPKGTEALRNPEGVACGIKAIRERTTIICVPGFPNEMLAMFDAYFLPLVTPEGAHEEVLRVKRRETTMEPLFQLITKDYGVKVASLPRADWRETGNVVVIKGPEEEVKAASKRFLELVIETRDEFEDE